jgi:hypothetical protein
MAVADGCPCGCGCDICKANDGSAEESATTETPAPETAAENPTQEKEPAMAESTTPAAETPGTPEESGGIEALGAKIDKLSDALAGFVTAMTPKPTTESAPQTPTTEAAPAAEPVQETEEQRIARLVAEQVAAAKAEMVQETVERYGPPSRKGLVRQVTENDATPGGGVGVNGLPEGWPDKPLHEYSRSERAQYLEPLVVQSFLGNRANRD